MRPLVKHFSMLCTGALLLACAGPAARAPMANNADQTYLIGRSYHMALRPELAMPYYEGALRADPAHLEARNGLAVLQAEQGKLNEAIAAWQHMTATAPGNGQAHLFSNLGYAYLIKGEPARALGVLEQACLLDPLNATAWQLLGDALDKIGQHARAAAMHRQADSLRGHDLRSDFASAGVPAIEGPRQPAAGEWAQTEITQGAGGMFVLRRIEPGTPAWTSAESEVQPAPPPTLEISNGNGRTGMARSVARNFTSSGYRVVRVSNQKGFGVKQTRLEYQPQFKSAAEQLGRQVGVDQVVPSRKPGRGDLRLVLGHDKTKPGFPAVAAVVRTPPKSS
jgi:hypothetical protein